MKEHDVAKAAKKAKKPAKAARTATAPPPAKPPKKGEPAGGWLQWRQTSRDTWLADDPEGDRSRAGARIKMLTQKWLGNDEPSYSVYRDAKYLGSDSSLEAAQRRAQYREQSVGVLSDTVDGKPDGLPRFAALTAEERAKTRGAAPQRAARPPVAAPPEPVDPALAKAAAERAALTRERAAPKVARSGKIPGTAVIRVVTESNPRRPGTVQHERYERIKAHDGKTVAEYVAAGGLPDALSYAAQGGHIRLEGET